MNEREDGRMTLTERIKAWLHPKHGMRSGCFYTLCQECRHSALSLGVVGGHRRCNCGAISPHGSGSVTRAWKRDHLQTTKAPPA